MSSPSQQTLNQIHAMMKTGHEGVRVERHSLILWGLTAALLVIFTNDLFNASWLNVHWMRVAAQNLFVGSVLFAVGLLDYHLTREKRRQRNESITFVQRQVTKIWWLLIALIVVVNAGANYFGGDYVFLGIAIVLAGIAVFINGLFSAQPMDWAGGLLIVAGLALLAVGLPRIEQEWVAASVFGMGLPLFALVIDKPVLVRQFAMQVILSLVWVAAVLVPAAMAIHWFDRVETPAGQPISLAEYTDQNMDRTGEWIVHLPVGTSVPIRWSISGDPVESVTDSAPLLQLSKDLDVVFVDGLPDGRYRIGEDECRLRRQHSRIRVNALQPEIADGQLIVDLKIKLSQIQS
ncbi:hypothetical protein DFR30_0721 [Thiogranum longum]|uniref:Uncharacterized protein n=1 Tax=Thiogranum longum TaxID=1537524 RepID=A0A4R1HAA6_9GAMM|nr:hypothetical protein [Thiogranum longum]TCK17491.1 hypothetical protein DFR30_0721 [Thiogranum longum]